MNDYKEEILKILNDTSLEENIMKQFKLDDIISGVDYLNDIKSTETDSTNQIKNNTFSISKFVYFLKYATVSIAQSAWIRT
jgi:hypothetical protein